MIDNFAILLSTAMTVYVILRAARLNRTLPWFERARPKEQTGTGPAAAPSRIAGLQRALKR